MFTGFGGDGETKPRMTLLLQFRDIDCYTVDI